MKALLNIKKDTLKVFLLVAVSVLALFEFIYRIGEISLNPTNLVFAHLIILLLMMFVFVLAILSIVLNKDDYAKFIALILVGYYIISMFLSFTSPLSRLSQYASKWAITSGVFVLIYTLYFSAIGVLALIAKFIGKENEFKKSIFILLEIGVCVGLVTFIFEMIAYIQADASWFYFFKLIMAQIFIPCTLLVTFLYYFGEQKTNEIEGE